MITIQPFPQNYPRGSEQPSGNQEIFLKQGGLNRCLLNQTLKPATVNDRSARLKNEFESKIGFQITGSVYAMLEKYGFSEDIPNAIISILSKILGNGVVDNKSFLINEMEKGIIIRDIETKNESISYELNSFYSLEEAKSIAEVIRA